METLFAAISLLAGSLLAVQGRAYTLPGKPAVCGERALAPPPASGPAANVSAGRANAQLSNATGSPFVATTLQLSVGTLALLVVAVLTGTFAAVALLPHAPWWHAIGGVASALYVVSTIVLFPRLGAVVTVGLFIAGPMLASLTLDSFGLFELTPKALDAATLLGTLAVVIGAAGIVFGQPGTSWTQQMQQIEGKLGWIALALVAGAVLPVQGAVNALLRADLGAPFVVGTVSFFVATLAMATLQLVIATVKDAPKSSVKPSASGVLQMPWWGWLGGFAGATYMTTMFTAIPVIGTAAAVGLTVAGQQVASVFVDRYGWFRLPMRPVLGLRLAGVALLLAGVALIQLF